MKYSISPCLSQLWYVAVMFVILSQSIYAQTTPTGQPSGVPTGSPTSHPTPVFNSQLSFNVSLLLREVTATSFNANTKCKRAVGLSLTDSLNLRAEEGYKFRGRAVAYASNVFGFDYNTIQPNPQAMTADIQPLESRNLGESKGNVGSSVTLTLYALPQSMGYSQDVDLDEVFDSLTSKLKKYAERTVIAGLLRDHGRSYGCAPLVATSAVEISYITSDYLTRMVHYGVPTSQPTLNPRVEGAKNRAGVIAGCIFGVTAFIMTSMYLAYHKNDVASILGLSFLLEREDNILETPEIISNNDI